MIRIDTYKDRPCTVVESDKLCATFLHEDGAKLTSLVCVSDGRELMATKAGKRYKRLAYDGSYVASECSAFDDMFPTIDPYVPADGIYRGIEYPDHGETCRIPYKVSIGNDGEAIFSSHSLRFGISYEKIACVAENGGIDVTYRIKNESGEDFPFVWAGHIMLAGEDGMRLVTPYDEKSNIEMIFMDGKRPQDPIPRDSLIGFSAGEGAAYKFYYTEPITSDGFSITYADGRALSFEYDREKLPYFGVWLNNGTFQESYTITPEPCSVPFDAPDKAAKRGYGSVIAAYDTLEFTIHIKLD